MNKRPGTSSHTLRAAAVLAVVVVASVVWVVYRTVEQAQVSDQSVLHTQEVLTSLEAVLATVLDADVAVRRFTASSDSRTLEPFDRAERAAEEGINQLATLTADNPNQQARVPELRQEIARALAALRVVADAKRAARADSSDRHRCRTGGDRCRTEHHSGDACGRESSACGSRASEPRGGPPSPAGLDRARRGRRRTAGMVWPGSSPALPVVNGQSTDTLRRANEDLETEAGVRAADLRDSNARLRSIIDSAVDGIIVIDAKGHIEAFNRGAERLFGYPASEVIGRNVNMLMPSPDHEAHDGYLARYLETGAAKIIGVGRQVTGRRRDGTTFPLHLSVGEMSIQGERKFTGMLHDLSERMRLDEELRASEARWRSVIDSAVDGIVVIDAHGRIEAFNPAAERLFGYEEREVDRPQRQHAHAVALSRRARHLSRTASRDGRSEDHRDGPRGHRPASRRHHVSAAPVGRQDDGRRRTEDSPGFCTI